jgi:hypothetical protein
VDVVCHPTQHHTAYQKLDLPLEQRLKAAPQVVSGAEVVDVVGLESNVCWPEWWRFFPEVLAGCREALVGHCTPRMLSCSAL